MISKSDKATQRELLTKAAQNSVQRGGLKALSFRTLADEVGIKSSSVHYYFPEKADLAQALIEEYSENFAAELQRISNTKGNLRSKLRRFIGIFEEVADNEKVCLCLMLAAEVEHLTEDNKKRLGQFFQYMEDWLSELLDRHSDEINAAQHTDKVASVMVSSLEGALLLDRLTSKPGAIKAQKDLYMNLLGLSS